MREIRQGRDRLTGVERAVADSLDEWLARHHAIWSASAYEDSFLAELRRRGYQVVWNTEPISPMPDQQTPGPGSSTGRCSCQNCS